MTIYNSYGVAYPDDPEIHPTYTIDSRFACGAAKWGGTHTCSCVYRRAVCGGVNHLCMCGDSWTALGCDCAETREKDMFMTETVPVKVTTTVELDGVVVSRTTYIQRVSPDKYAVEVRNSAIREMLRETASTTGESFRAAGSSLSDDLFVKAGYEPKRSCCSTTPPPTDQYDPDSDDYNDSFGR